VLEPIPHSFNTTFPRTFPRSVSTPGAAFKAPPWRALLKVNLWHHDQNVDPAPTVRAAPMTKWEEAALDRVLVAADCPATTDALAGEKSSARWEKRGGWWQAALRDGPTEHPGLEVHKNPGFKPP
jgi:hypothetical protein